MSDRKPNVLLLFTDQHRADVLGCEDHPDVLTPSLDALAAQGTRFTRAICQDAVCVPSRSSMMSGLYPRTIGCLHNNDTCPTMQRVVPMARAFADAGYLTAAYGKRHLPREPYATDDGWTEHCGYSPHESPGTSYTDWLTDPKDKAAFDRDWQAEWGPACAPLASQVSELPADKTMEAFTAEHTIDLIRRSADGEQPFFCWASFYRPHQPYTPLPEYYERFDRSHWGEGRRAGDGLRMPATLRQSPDELPPGVIAHTAGSETWPLERAREDEQLWRHYLACYYACMEEVDHHIGRILAALDQTGQADNTIVVYISDHGEFVGHHGIAEKAASGHNVYMDSLRVPMIWRLPQGSPRGAVCDDIAELVDLYPTLVELTGIDLPEMPFELAGRSLAPTLTEGRPIDRPFTVSENWAQSTVVTGTHVLGVWRDPHGKLMDQRELHPNMLFDLRTDPDQVHNLYDDPAHAAERDLLAGYLDQWVSQTPDTGMREHLEVSSLKA